MHTTLGIYVIEIPQGEEVYIFLKNPLGIIAISYYLYPPFGTRILKMKFGTTISTLFIGVFYCMDIVLRKQ
jgi:hypothetical protein